MDEDKNRRMVELVEQIKIEQDQNKFTALVDELNRLLDDETPASKPISPDRVG